MSNPKKFKVSDQLLARFTVCVDTATFNKLTDLAQRRKVARSELVRDILVNYIAARQARRLEKEPANVQV